MVNIYKINKQVLDIILIAVAVAVTMLAIFNGLILKPDNNGGNISVGSVAMQRYTATRDVVNNIATERLRREAAKSVPPSYRRDVDVEESVYTNLNNFFKILDNYRIEYKQKSLAAINGDEGVPSINSLNMTTALPIELSEKLRSAVVVLSDDEYGNFKIDVITVVKDVFELEIKSGTSDAGEDTINEETKSEIRDATRIMFDSIETQNLSYSIISAYMKQNMFYDQEATEKYRQEVSDAVDPVIIKETQMLIDKGQIITEEVYDILESLGLVQKSVTVMVWTIIGIICVILIIGSVAIYYLNSCSYEHLIKPMEKLMFFTFYVMCVFFIWILKEQQFYVLPISIFTMLIAILINSNLAIIMNICFATLAFLIAKLNLDHYIFFIFSGIIVAMLSKSVTQRSKIISIGFIVSMADVILFLGISLLSSNELTERILLDAAIVFAYAIVSVIFVIGSLPLWETTFGVITTIKLLDLTNPANPVLKRLTVEAPGTYHHSLIVANLAEAAAIDIGANHILARVGGYYHDIGKLKYPSYFYENQVSGNPHDSMGPYDSVEVIKSHVSYGQELVSLYKLPNIIKDMILMHHGNTLIKYFYAKAKESMGDVNMDDFRYSFVIPKFKEAAIIMLADTVEAAVRSLIPSGKSMQEVEVFIRKLVNDKLNDGQLLESNLTIKDIEDIIKSFMRVFRGMYHERIAYPADDKGKDISGSEEKEDNLIPDIEKERPATEI
ncbi:MAG: HDIG domain-containing protein [Clostridiales bacterium]|jgi:putative nucleotidyltransferase with HDIG domain|nr:HDIG domain-containing protein [Clostridiales bacterium]